jgi:ribosomal protein L11 methylase PrmA
MFQEEKTFNLRFALEAKFPDDYEGNEDGQMWVKEWEQRLKPELVKLVFDYLRRHPAWTVHVRNRGASSLDEIEIAMERAFTDPGTGADRDSGGK